MKFWQKNRVKAAMAAIFSITCIFVGRSWYLEEQGNFHPISAGAAYRSAQLDRDELAYYIRKFAIRSIINLRGKEAREPWYKEEIAICRELGVRHFDLRLKPDKAPALSKIDLLLKVFRLAPRPLLIHRRAGADRSGLASALWKVVVDSQSLSIAKKQLSIFYGHMPFGPTQVLDTFLTSWVHARKGKMNTNENDQMLF